MAAKVLVEVVCCSVDECIAAEMAGADRIELCDQIELGGLTPGQDLMVQARKSCSLPVVAMVRPRPGDFVYTAAEIAIMSQQAHWLSRSGVQGLVLGCLTREGTINEAGCLATLTGTHVDPIFHRAIDHTSDIFASLARVEAIGFVRVLSSGGAATALEGAGTLRRMRDAATIDLLPGGNIRASNVLEVLELTGANQVHFAPFRGGGKQQIEQGMAEIAAVRAKLGL